MKALDFTASTPYDCQKNYNVLKSVINKLKLPIVSRSDRFDDYRT